MKIDRVWKYVANKEHKMVYHLQLLWTPAGWKYIDDEECWTSMYHSNDVFDTQAEANTSMNNYLDEQIKILQDKKKLFR